MRKNIIIVMLIALFFLLPDMVVAEGSGTPEDPYQINTIEDLDAIRDNLSAYYILMRSLDFNDDDSYDNPSNKTDYITGSGWLPISNFNGSFDGQNHTISNLFIYRPTSEGVGLFTGTTSNSIIKNIGLINNNVTGQQQVGSLVGYNDGSVSNCFAWTGNIHGKLIATYNFFGGLVGHNTGTISNCWADMDVEGYASVGVLSGSNYPTGSITQCFSKGNVSSVVGHAGGLVGHQWQGTISNCYSHASVSGTNTVGGFLGFFNQGTVTKCYSTGLVEYSGTGGGFIGGINGALTCTYCFWDMETSNQSTSPRGTGKTTAQMKDITTFSGATWNIVGVSEGEKNTSYIWNIVDDVTYPFLSWYEEPIEEEINSLPVLSNENPVNETADVSIYLPIWNITVEDPDGDLMNISIECSSGDSTMTSDTTNGSFNVSFDTLNINTTYIIWVNVTDGTDWTREWFIFDTILYPPWDINQDGIVNYLDVSALVSHYRETGTPYWIPEDINDDGVINYLDVSSLVSHYREDYR